MQRISDVSKVPAIEELVVIINCGTRWVTTLALLSSLKTARSQVLLIDCESRDGSFGHFARLARKYALTFYWLDWPLRSHPAALDALFTAVKAHRVLLVDSDLEIVDPRIVESMRTALDASESAYGGGFLHGRRGWDRTAACTIAPGCTPNACGSRV
jgi:hypothetical protein